MLEDEHEDPERSTDRQHVHEQGFQWQHEGAREQEQQNEGRQPEKRERPG